MDNCVFRLEEVYRRKIDRNLSFMGDVAIIIVMSKQHNFGAVSYSNEEGIQYFGDSVSEICCQCMGNIQYCRKFCRIDQSNPSFILQYKMLPKNIFLKLILDRNISLFIQGKSDLTSNAYISTWREPSLCFNT